MISFSSFHFVLFLFFYLFLFDFFYFSIFFFLYRVVLNRLQFFFYLNVFYCFFLQFFLNIFLVLLNLFLLCFYLTPISFLGKMSFGHYTVHLLGRNLLKLERLFKKRITNKWRVKFVSCVLLKNISKTFTKIIQNQKL